MNKEESNWPLGSYIACIIGTAAVFFLKLHAAQMGGAYFSGGQIFPIFLGISPFLFAVLAINLDDNIRARKFLSLATILQSIAAIAAYCYAIFGNPAEALDTGLIPLFQFAFLGLASAVSRLFDAKKTPGHHWK